MTVFQGADASLEINYVCWPSFKWGIKEPSLQERISFTQQEVSHFLKEGFIVPTSLKL